MKFGIILHFLVIISCNFNPNSEKKIAKVVKQRYNTKILVLVQKSLNVKRSSIEIQLEKQGLVNIREIDSSIQIEIKYATTDNFTKIILYDSLREAYLHPIAAEKLVKAQKILKEKDTTLSLLLYDAVRPLSVQKKMYEVVQNTPYSSYVANPTRTGLHNYGLAVDLTICNQEGTPLDMGTPFDFFGRKAGISEDEILIKQRKLTRQQVDNRMLLRSVMTDAGFFTIRGEWWHFNALSLHEAKKTVKLIE